MATISESHRNRIGTDTVFAIQFHSVEPTEIGGLAIGSIALGSYRESFECPIHLWRREDYEEHWVQAVERLVNGAESTALITELYDPASASFIKWWPAYRFGARVTFHNQLLLMADLPTPFELRDIYRHIPPYQQVNEDGDRISEWSVPIEQLESFLSRGDEREPW